MVLAARSVGEWADRQRCGQLARSAGSSVDFLSGWAPWQLMNVSVPSVLLSAGEGGAELGVGVGGDGPLSAGHFPGQQEWVRSQQGCSGPRRRQFEAILQLGVRRLGEP